MTVLLVRHTEVALAWRGRCYGRSDMGLSRVGAERAAALAGGLAEWRPDVVMHSGLRRAQFLATQVAGLAGAPVRGDAAWGERDFGDWEGRTWAAIYRASGNAMDGMVSAPGAFRPGGGETTDEMADRADRAFAALAAGRVIVVGHGGPIAALRGRHARLPVSGWLDLVPGYGEAVELARPGFSSAKK